ncbi:hypothetical protein ACUN9Y_09595 [Halomonas sp. V046]|uniref:hypothetical protein n=1 Tax=Halomonas sp. V046 TaxID=3459611 RepID=UPI00404509B4
MIITKDTRMAWALARDDGMRSQHEIIVARLEQGCDINPGAKGGAGAGLLADYARVHSCIEAMSAPERHVGDALNCRGVLSDGSHKKATIQAALAVSQLAAQRMPGFHRWSPARQQMLYWVALAAIERQWVLLYDIPEKTDFKGREEGRTLSEPWKIGKWIRGKHGQSLDLKNWGKQWSDAWVLLQEVIQELDFSGIETLNSRCYIQNSWRKAG